MKLRWSRILEGHSRPSCVEPLKPLARRQRRKPLGRSPHAQALEPRELLTTFSVVASTPQAIESSLTPGVVTVSVANQPAGQPVTVAYSVTGGVVGTDYVALPGSATVPAGSSSVAIDVTPVGNHAPGPNVDLTLTLTPSNAYQLAAAASAGVTIVEPGPAMTLSDVGKTMVNGASTDDFGTTPFEFS